MGTPNQPTPASSAANILGILQQANGYIALGVQVGNLLIPLGRGLIAEIRKIGAGSESQSYEIVVRMDLAEIEDTKKMSTDDLTAINEEFTRMGLPTVPVPTPEAPPTPPPAPEG